TPHPPRTWRTGYTRPGRLDGHRPVAIEPARENTHEPPLVFHKQLGNRLLDAQLTARTHGTECQHSQRGFRVSGQRQVGTGEIHLITAPRQLNVVVDTCTLPATRLHRNDLLHTRRHVLAPSRAISAEKCCGSSIMFEVPSTGGRSRRRSSVNR